MDKEIFLEQLKTLVNYETLSDDQTENTKALDYLASQVSSQATVKRFSSQEAQILIAANRNYLKPDICFLAHIDVVAAAGKLFKLRVKNGLAFGRGVSDMKFSLPIGVSLLNELIVKKAKLSFALVVTTDEELGGFKGAKYLVEKLKFKPKVLIVPDGGDNLLFVEKAKGVCQIKVESFGRTAHSSRIFEGKNALEPLAVLINQLLAKYGKSNQRRTWKTTMNIGQIHGGVSTNQVCDFAFCNLDFRFPESTSLEKIFSEVKKLAEKIDLDLKISLLSTGQPTFTDKNEKIVVRFIKTLEKEMRKKVKIGRTFGASDARHFSALKIPVLMIKPIGGNIHSDDEFISIDSCLAFARAVSTFLRKEEKGYGKN